MSYPNIKAQVLDCCFQWANERQRAILKKEASLLEALQGASKSSAGDKHNTERAMLQIEREQLGNQAVAIKQDLDTIYRIDPEETSNIIHLGSLVYASNAIYFVSVSAGVFTVKNYQIVAISSAAPIARELLGKTIGESFSWQGKAYEILAVH